VRVLRVDGPLQVDVGDGWFVLLMPVPEVSLGERFRQRDLDFPVRKSAIASIVITSTTTRRASERRADCRRTCQGAGPGVHWYDAPSEGCCSFVFPCVKDPGNLLPFKA
jgi:hypothetical protein